MVSHSHSLYWIILAKGKIRFEGFLKLLIKRFGMFLPTFKVIEHFLNLPYLATRVTKALIANTTLTD